MEYAVDVDSHRQLLEHDRMPAGEPSHEFSNLSDRVQSDHERKTDAPYSGYDASPKMWNPIWLHRMTLISFVFIFAALFITVIVLFHFSEILHGLSTQIPANHYSWTYGPTACKYFSTLITLDLLLIKNSARDNLGILAPSRLPVQDFSPVGIGLPQHSSRLYFAFDPEKSLRCHEEWSLGSCRIIIWIYLAKTHSRSSYTIGCVL